MTGSTRRVVAVSCIALIVFAAFLPLGGFSLDWLVITPAFTLLPPFATLLVRRDAAPVNERPVALLGILDSRGPPPRSSLT